MPTQHRNGALRNLCSGRGTPREFCSALAISADSPQSLDRSAQPKRYLAEAEG